MPLHAAPFEKVRRDHSLETAEDYAEAVSDLISLHGECRVKHLVVHMGVSHVTVTRIVSRLQDEGLLHTEPYLPINLTPRGKKLAHRSQQRHQIVLDFLRAIGVPEKHAQHDAEGIEHHVGKATMQRMKIFIKSINGKKA